MIDNPDKTAALVAGLKASLPLSARPTAEVLKTLRQHGRNGRPLGAAGFVARLETELGRHIGSGRRGRPPKA